MSTYLYLRCLDHDPPIEAGSGQHLYDLPQIQADIADRDALVAAWLDEEAGPDSIENDYFRSHTVGFLAQHPKCRIGIQDEYGRDHPLAEAPGAADGAGVGTESGEAGSDG